jgi:hypothetical protein
MTYDILGGGSFAATTPLEVVEALRLDAMEWVPSVGIEDFMEGMAQRCQVQTGAVVRTDSVANFVDDLQEHGFITPHA